VDQTGCLEIIEIRKFSLPCSQSKPPFLDQPAIPSAATLSQSAHTISASQLTLHQPVSSHYISQSAHTISASQLTLYQPVSSHYISQSAHTVSASELTLYQPVSSHYISQSAHSISRHQELSKIVLLRIIKFYITITQSFLSY
jgi:multisubunit Na+/H+ antiporter MnhG subunit